MEISIESHFLVQDRASSSSGKRAHTVLVTETNKTVLPSRHLTKTTSLFLTALMSPHEEKEYTCSYQQCPSDVELNENDNQTAFSSRIWKKEVNGKNNEVVKNGVSLQSSVSWPLECRAVREPHGGGLRFRGQAVCCSSSLPSVHNHLIGLVINTAHFYTGQT